MKRMYKLLSVLLCLAMLIGWIPVVAYAADSTTDESGTPAATAAGDTYELVTDASTLAVGDKIVIVTTEQYTGKDSTGNSVTSYWALSTTQNSNNRGQAAVTKNADNTVTINDKVQVLTLENGMVSGTFAFNIGDKYLYAPSTSNGLKTKTTVDANGSWTITIAKDTGVATVKANGSGTRNYLRYNSGNNPPIFSCYGSGQKDISIYKLPKTDPTTCTHTNKDYKHIDNTSQHSVVCLDCKSVLEPETCVLEEDKYYLNPDDDSTHIQKCKYCGTQVGDAESHTPGGYVNLGSEGHAQNCTVCGENYGTESHTCTNPGEKCNSCDYVVPAAPVTPPKGTTGKTATLVTDISDLKLGDYIIIVAKGNDFALGTTQNNNRPAVGITKGENTVIIGENEVQVLTFAQGNKEGTYAFYTGSGYLYAASSSSNYLKTEEDLSDNSSWTISIAADGVATVKAQGTNTRNWLRYNTNNNSPIFSCYGSTSNQEDISIYKVDMPEFDSASLVLSGEIGVNFYMNIPAYAQNGKMVFTVSGKNGKTTEINCSDATVVDGQYKFTCYVNAIQMADTITATYYYGTDNAETIVQTYSVQQYINAVASSGQPDTVKALAAALANYGHYTQLWLAAENNFTIDGDHAKINSSGELVVEGLDLSRFGCTIADKIDGVDVYGALSLDAKTTLYLYFTVDAEKYNGELTVTVGGTSADVEKMSNGQYRVAIPGIPAHLLGEKYTVVVNGTMTVTVSALSYAHAVLSGTTVSENAKNAMAALYAYYIATDAYQNTLTK